MYVCHGVKQEVVCICLRPEGTVREFSRYQTQAPPMSREDESVLESFLAEKFQSLRLLHSPSQDAAAGTRQPRLAASSHLGPCHQGKTMSRSTFASLHHHILQPPS